MNEIRILRFVHRRIQRLGFLKKILTLASAEKPSTQQAIGDSFLASITKKYQVPASEDVLKYFDRVFTDAPKIFFAKIIQILRKKF